MIDNYCAARYGTTVQKIASDAYARGVAEGRRRAVARERKLLRLAKLWRAKLMFVTSQGFCYAPEHQRHESSPVYRNEHAKVKM